MKLSEILKLVMTCDEQGLSPEIENILSPWEHDPGSGRLLRASSNFVFIYQKNGQPQILRCTPAAQRSAAAIEAEIDFLNHLHLHGVQVNRPALSRSKNWIETVETSLGCYHTVALEFISGSLLELRDLSPDQVFKWGKTLGEFHNAAQGYMDKRVDSWKAHLNWAQQVLSPQDQPARDVLRILDTRLSNLPVRTDNFGLIHYDFELDNLLWDEPRTEARIIDLGDCAYYWFTADIAYALRDLFNDCASQVNLQHPSFYQFVQGYRSVRNLPEDELQCIPPLMLLLNLLKYIELQIIVTEAPSPDEPAWVINLRQHLVKMVAGYSRELSLALESPG